MFQFPKTNLSETSAVQQVTSVSSPVLAGDTTSSWSLISTVRTQTVDFSKTSAVPQVTSVFSPIISGDATPSQAISSTARPKTIDLSETTVKQKTNVE